MMNWRIFNKKSLGFTLIELLVTTAILGFLAIVSAVIVSAVIKSQNKTEIINEVRGNGDLVIAKFERDVKGASLIVRNNQRRLTLSYEDSPTVIWDCSTSNFTRNGAIVTNNDPIRGVRIALTTTLPFTRECSFTVAPTPKTPGIPQIATLDFTLDQRSTAQRQEFQIREDFEVTVGSRAYQ